MKGDGGNALPLAPRLRGFLWPMGRTGGCARQGVPGCAGGLCGLRGRKGMS